ncbi:hypothetical protein E2C01_059885 [Portunus trituberculatus]|uniref:Uncharacterized protein n=1 Tax=Portunus trituberculatus TaxID=210409 RepID=A0A5B7H7G0_PORTR|nr:hypothetical protein [Portunus trituberculatus]
MLLEDTSITVRCVTTTPENSTIMLSKDHNHVSQGSYIEQMEPTSLMKDSTKNDQHLMVGRDVYGEECAKAQDSTFCRNSCHLKV